LAGRWEIIPTKVEISPNENGWKYVRIEIALKNKTTGSSKPSINVADTKLLTKPDAHSYPAQAFRTTTTTGETSEIELKGFLPPNFLLRGECRDDAFMFYEFQARIPDDTFPWKLIILGYGEIPVSETPSVTQMIYPYPTTEPTYSPTQNMGQPIEIPGKATLTVVNFSWAKGWPKIDNRPPHDRITATLRLANSQAYTTTRNLEFAALGSSGFLGYNLADVPGCKPTLTLAPSQTITTPLCIMVPPDEQNVRFIMTGDTYGVYQVPP
jgi:hypothetical protein